MGCWATFGTNLAERVIDLSAPNGNELAYVKKNLLSGGDLRVEDKSNFFGKDCAASVRFTPDSDTVSDMSLPGVGGSQRDLPPLKTESLPPELW